MKRKIKKIDLASSFWLTPIVFAYCYCIKGISGLSRDKLILYREEILEFCGK